MAEPAEFHAVSAGLMDIDLMGVDGRMDDAEQRMAECMDFPIEVVKFSMQPRFTPTNPSSSDILCLSY